MKDWVGNKNSIFKIIGSSNHTNEDREENDYYATSPIAIDKLLKVETPNHNIWECAAGEGHLSKRLTELGFSVYSTDLIKRNFELDNTVDFLQTKKMNFEYDILTNPPYKYAKEFVLHALELVDEGNKVYMFLKLTFLEGKSRYKDLFSKYPPQKIYVFVDRLMCAKNGEFEKYNNHGIAHGAVAYAWFVWQKGWQGKSIIEWI